MLIFSRYSTNGCSGVFASASGVILCRLPARCGVREINAVETAGTPGIVLIMEFNVKSGSLSRYGAVDRHKGVSMLLSTKHNVCFPVYTLLCE